MRRLTKATSLCACRFSKDYICSLKSFLEAKHVTHVLLTSQFLDLNSTKCVRNIHLLEVSVCTWLNNLTTMKFRSAELRGLRTKYIFCRLILSNWIHSTLTIVSILTEGKIWNMAVIFVSNLLIFIWISIMQCIQWNQLFSLYNKTKYSRIDSNHQHLFCRSECRWQKDFTRSSPSSSDDGSTAKVIRSQFFRPTASPAILKYFTKIKHSRSFNFVSFFVFITSYKSIYYEKICFLHLFDNINWRAITLKNFSLEIGHTGKEKYENFASLNEMPLAPGS